MRKSTLETLAPLLRFLRGYDVLEETAGVKFLLNGQDFIHFHDAPDGLWADVKLAKGRIRLSVAKASEQGELMEKISATLESLQEHDFKKSSRKTRGKRA